MKPSIDCRKDPPRISGNERVLPPSRWLLVDLPLPPLLSLSNPRPRRSHTNMSSASLRSTTQIPAKTLNKTPFLPPFSRPCRLSMPKSRTQSISPLSSALLQSQTLDLTGGRRDEIVPLAKKALSNCLSETHLDLTVPGLKCKAKGKVNFNFFFCSLSNFIFCIFFQKES